MSRLLRAGLVGALFLTGGAALAVEVPELRDLRAEAAQVRGQRTTLMLMFHADHCVYCQRMENEFLKPMLISGDYEGKVIMRRVKLDPAYMLRDFDGARITGAELAERYRVFVTPTLLFLDASGGQVAEKMVGLSTPDFFGGYLDAAIDTALTRLHGGRPAVAGRLDDACNPLC